jgi:hypothetical protein
LSACVAVERLFDASRAGISQMFAFSDIETPFQQGSAWDRSMFARLCF